MTSTFIRLDMEGNWKGKEHCSTFAMDPEYWGDDTQWEAGISCYNLRDTGFAIENLRYYWEEIAQMKGNYTSPVRMFVTVFRGYKLDKVGHEMEDMAICEETLLHFPAQEFMNEVIAAYERYEYGDNENDPHGDEELYHQELEGIAKKWIEKKEEQRNESD
jgi:hypothetical protein